MLCTIIHTAVFTQICTTMFFHPQFAVFNNRKKQKGSLSHVSSSVIHIFSLNISVKYSQYLIHLWLIVFLKEIFYLKKIVMLQTVSTF